MNEVIQQELEELEQLKPNLVLEHMKGWLPELIDFAIHLAVAGLIVFVGLRVKKMLHKMVHKSFTRMEMDVSVRRFLLSVVDAIMLAIIIFIAAEELGIPSASIIAILGSAGVAVGLSLKDSLSNIAGGILIMLLRPFGVGDYVSCAGTEGTVKNIGIFYTTLTSGDNKEITVPNGNISSDTIVNVSAQEKRRVDVTVGIGYHSDMKLAKEIIYQIYAEHPLVIAEDPITVFVSELADSAVVLGGRAWVKNRDYWKVKWDVTEMIKERFDAEGIEIPFNQLDVNLKN